MGSAGKVNGVADTLRGYSSALGDGMTSIDAAISLSDTVYEYPVQLRGRCTPLR